MSRCLLIPALGQGEGPRGEQGELRPWAARGAGGEVDVGKSLRHGEKLTGRHGLTG